jgi:uncharacterized protein (DUF1778 family)
MTSANETEMATDEAMMTQGSRIKTEAQKLTLTERDSLRVLDLLDNPPEPAARLLRAA